MHIKTITYRVVHAGKVYKMNMSKVVGVRVREKVRVVSKKK